ncbi:TPA: hypothetical protein TUY17_001056 [Streptococcus equi subsp. zooepidemicus]|uniref:hypothetical protein n=1 Tax=Streptococcus equi TaxID=1336 RepID=UPI0005B7418A|nr:hypothetical protein [Streptococcus equi]KIQ75862.1 hypothetical protein QQ41_05555 [Streptococcus equi subsp. zooepidemicus]MCD3422517.1 hypothetical protein [Streptococcus equi subsp. zooepidemicus]MDI5919144.1 hypothetical protein [Streptococcus equi subsp. zooepidemicus]MDI5957196.1 hypothetical protein [Streptococcus equi subsp. zooepidemicus]HEL0733496.1 hypothetical protein [Streptococcus equi subsp. zooepidemicus]
MGITQMTWEEYETFNKVETPDNLYIREHNGTYYTVFELGIASVRRIFELSAADFEEYLKGLRTADEILFKAQNDCWPPTEEEKNRIMKERAKDRPMVLISNPKNQMLFTQEELRKLIPIAEQKWIDWKGKLPDDYISPLK